MDWVTQVLLFGFTALAFFILSLVFARAKKHLLGLGFAVLELLSAVASTCPWMKALKDSGKIDWYLFGIFTYPLAGMIFISMFAVGILCVLVHSWGLITNLTDQAGRRDP